MSDLRLTFLGATDTVTGSRTLVEGGGRRVLVDCGIFQGLKRDRLRNWRALPVEPDSIDAVILTHAHLDHSGYLPVLVRDGFVGRVHVTAPTRALCGVLLPDSGHIQEEDARYANRRGFSKHRPALPLYTEAAGVRALAQLDVLELDTALSIGDMEIRLRRAGHILGAASVEISCGGRSVLFSGDLGRPNDLLMPAPTEPGAPDFVVLESTYGDRRHSKDDPVAQLAAILARCLEKDGTLLVPSFAVGRSQSILYCLHEAFRRNLVPRVPVFLDSPMATDATSIFRRFTDWHRLSPESCEEVCGLAHYVRTADESKALSESEEGRRVIISASGMATGGRVIHHLKHMAPNPRNTVFLPGYQAAGTRGEALVHGAASVKIHGRLVPVRARVEHSDLLSAHADQAELLDWLSKCSSPPQRVFVNHGEPLASDTLRREIGERLGIDAVVPEHGAVIELR